MDLPKDMIENCLANKSTILLQVGRDHVNIIVVLINVGEHIITFKCIPIMYPVLSNLFIQLLILLFKVQNKMAQFIMKPLPIAIY
jgi:hypothetical protein